MKIIPPVGSWVVINKLGAIGQIVDVQSNFLYNAEDSMRRRRPKVKVSSSALEDGVDYFELESVELIGGGDIE